MRLRAESLMRRTLAATSRPPRPPRTLSPSARNNVDTCRDHTGGAEARQATALVLLRARRGECVTRPRRRSNTWCGARIELPQQGGGRLAHDAAPATAPAGAERQV